MKNTNLQVYEAQQTGPRYIIIKVLDSYTKEHVLKSVLETTCLHRNNRNDNWLLNINIKMQIQLRDIFKVLKEKTINLESYVQWNYLWEMKLK